MKEHRILVTGKQKAMLDDVFRYVSEEFMLMSTSIRYDDISNHLEIFKPEVLVICLGDETAEDYSTYEKLKSMLPKTDTAAFIVGSTDDCNKFISALPYMAAESFTKPISFDRVKNSITWYLQDKENAKKAEEEKKAAEEAKKNEQNASGAGTTGNAGVSGQEAEGAEEDEFDVPGIVPMTNKKKEPKKHVLVIDDDPLMLRVVKEQLRGLYDVAAAVNGRIAYKFLETKSTDMILLDYEMPIENGKVVLENIRKMPGMDKVPVVFLTGVNDSERIREVLELNPQGYLLKPIDRDTLIAAVRKCIGK
ncbi:MAG: response regulator [Lachnospiraceae bacterium]|nr:response regulator [Lachnospiraceae bacterium]